MQGFLDVAAKVFVHELDDVGRDDHFKHNRHDIDQNEEENDQLRAC